MYIFPSAYEQEWIKNDNSKNLEQFISMPINENISKKNYVFSKQCLEQRKQSLRAKQVSIVKKKHQEWMKTKGYNITPEQHRSWHHEFNIHSLKDDEQIPMKELPVLWHLWNSSKLLTEKMEYYNKIKTLKIC